MNKSNYKRFNSSLMLSTVGIVIVIVMSLLVLYWESYGRYKVLYTDIIVLKQDANKGTIITESMLSKEKYERSKLLKNPIINETDIIGKAASHYIPSNTPLTKLYFTNIVVEKGYFIAKMPNDWLLSVPETIRRGDKAAIYLSKSVTSNTIQQQNSTSTNVNTYTQNDLNNVKSDLGSKLIETTVAYVKDSANKEIVDQSNEDRLNASSKIDSVEVVLSSEQLSTLQSFASAGNKFIMVYSENN